MKHETLNVPIRRLTVNNEEFPYEVANDMLRLDVSVPAGTTLEIIIEYDTDAAVASLPGLDSEDSN
jgi:hypothetical protein